MGLSAEETAAAAEKVHGIQRGKLARLQVRHRPSCSVVSGHICGKIWLLRNHFQMVVIIFHFKLRGPAASVYCCPLTTALHSPLAALPAYRCACARLCVRAVRLLCDTCLCVCRRCDTCAVRLLCDTVCMFRQLAAQQAAAAVDLEEEKEEIDILAGLLALSPCS